MAFLLIVGQLCCGVAVSAEIVAAYVDVFKSIALKQGAHFFGETRVDFKVKPSAWNKCLPGLSCYSFIEKQRIVVGNEKSRVGLVVEHMGLDILCLRCAHIGRIAHYDVIFG